ncbi:MAG: hypothetical protein ACRDDO_08480 [Plesiomonas shigelloides]
MSEQLSKNGKAYALLNFDQVNEKGLKKLSDAFKRAGCPVASVDADNRARRKDGMPIKTFKMRFEDQQEIEVSVGVKGDIIQTKLNKKIIPVNQASKLADYAKDVAGKVKAGASSFAKSLARKVKAVTDQSTRKPAAKPLLTQAREAQNYLTDVTRNIEVLRTRIGELETQTATSTAELQRQTARLNSEREITKQLNDQLSALEAA